MYEKAEIKKHKGNLIRLTYNGRNRKIQTGKITAITNDHILFKVNGEYEKPIEISKKSHIEQLKTFSHYIRTARKYSIDLKPDKAIYTLQCMESIFHLPEQILKIDELKKKSIEIGWKVYKLGKE